MKKNVAICLIALGSFLFLSSVAFLTMGMESHEEPKLCVDGDGDINLEGIKCLKMVTTVYGEDPSGLLPGSLFLMGLIGGIVFTIGFTCLWEA